MLVCALKFHHVLILLLKSYTKKLLVKIISIFHL
jgi:hypothetical protein